METVKIYTLSDPRDAAIRYVGQAKDTEKRLSAHCHHPHTKSLSRWILSLDDEALYPLLNVVEICSAEVSTQREKYWIQRLLEEGHSLLNNQHMPHQPSVKTVPVFGTSTMIGMAEAGKRMGMTSNAARLSLMNAGVPLAAISARLSMVDEADLAAYIASRPAGYKGRGRPPGARNKPKNKPAD